MSVQEGWHPAPPRRHQLATRKASFVARRHTWMVVSRTATSAVRWQVEIKLLCPGITCTPSQMRIRHVGCILRAARNVVVLRPPQELGQAAVLADIRRRAGATPFGPNLRGPPPPPTPPGLSQQELSSNVNPTPTLSVHQLSDVSTSISAQTPQIRCSLLGRTPRPSHESRRTVPSAALEHSSASEALVKHVSSMQRLSRQASSSNHVRKPSMC